MTIEYTGRESYTVSGKLKKQADDSLARIEEIAGRSVSAHVILSEDRHRKIAEVTLKTATDTLVATCEDAEMEKALHDALRKIEQQAVKHNQRKTTLERQAKPDSAEPMIEVPSTNV